MSNRINKRAYQRHEYSGRTKHPKQVKAALKRYHNETSRPAIWRPKNSSQNTNENIGHADSISQISNSPLDTCILKTYARKRPQIRMAQSNDLRDKVVNFARANPIQNISAIGRRFGIHRHTVTKWLVQEGLIFKEEGFSILFYNKRKRGSETEKESNSKKKKKDADNDKCCCCLTEAGDRNIWSTGKKSGDDNVYGRLLQQCFDITIGNQNIKEGHTICNNCTEQLKQALQFKQQVLECQHKIRKSMCEIKETLAFESKSELPDLYDLPQDDKVDRNEALLDDDDKPLATLEKTKAGISADLEENSYNQDENVENQLELEPEPDLEMECEPEFETEPEAVFCAEAEPKLVLEVDVNEEASVKFEPDGDDDEVDDEHVAIQEEEVEAELFLEGGPDPLDGINIKPGVYVVPKEEIECVSSTIDDSAIDKSNTLLDCIEPATNTGQASADAVFNCTQREMLIQPSNIVQDFNRRGQDMLQSFNERLPVPQAKPSSQLLRVYKPKRPAAVKEIEEVPKQNTSKGHTKVKNVIVNYLRKKERNKVMQQSFIERLPVPQVMQQSFDERLPVPQAKPCLRVYKPKRPAAVNEIEEVPKPNTSKEHSIVKKVVESYLDLLR